MRAIEYIPVSVLFPLLVGLCLAFESGGQSSPTGGKAGGKTSPVRGAAASDWQAILVSGKGVKFRLPAGWRHDGHDLKREDENAVVEALEWNTPDQELIRIFFTTFKKGFVSSGGRAASRGEMLEEKFRRQTQASADDSSYSEVKKLRLGGAEGVFRVLDIKFKDEALGARKGLIWTGYRIYGGRAQEVEINLSAPSTSESLLRKIFATLEVEQDGGTK